MLGLLLSLVGGAKAITIDDVVGSYVESSAGNFYYSTSSSWEAIGGINYTSISKVDDTTVEIENFLNWGYNLQATFNADNGTLVIASGLKLDDYYALYAYDMVNDVKVINNNDLVISLQDDGSFSISCWAMVYNGAIYGYGESKYTKNAALWSAQGSYTTDTDWRPSGEATLIAYDTYYKLENVFAEGFSFSFTVTEGGELRLIDSALADQFDPEESGYWYYYITSWYDNVGIYTFDGMFNFSGSIEGGQLQFDFEYADDYNKEEPDCSGTCTFVWNKGVSAVQTAKTAAAAPQGVYTISGVRVADSAEVLSSLPAGLYVVNGKVVVK